MENEQVKPLSVIKAGARVRLVRVDAGQGLKSRLTAMGLLPGVEFTVVNNRHPGPFMISIRDNKMMLGRGMAHKLLVEQCD